jgi:hypothetical protein
MKTQNTFQAAINYLSIYCKKSDSFNDFKFIGQSIDNPLKVSYIKQEKIDGILEHTGKKIVGTKEQRQKYFISVDFKKLISKMFLDSAEGEIQIKKENVSDDINKQLRKNFFNDLELFFEDDIAGFYSQEDGDYIYSHTGSCMDKKDVSFFDLYHNINNCKVQIVGLKNGRKVVARALLWEHSKGVYLDRIYTNSSFENDGSREHLQVILASRVKRITNAKKLYCFQAQRIKSFIVDKYNLTHEQKEKGIDKQFICQSRIPFTPQIEIEAADRFDYFPYMDTFQYMKEGSNNYFLTLDGDGAIYQLDCTDGERSDCERWYCDGCDCSYSSEDDISYSEYEDCYLCYDCGEWSEYEQDTIRRDYLAEHPQTHDLINTDRL